MTSAEIDKNNCLVIDEDQFRNYHLHPLWLRERMTEPEFLDSNNYQRLYEPSLIAQNIRIKNFSIEKDILKIKFSDGSEGSFFLNALLVELKQKDIIPEKKPWKNEFVNLPIYDFNSLNEVKVFQNLLSDFQELGFVIVKNTSAEEGTVIKFAEMFGPVRTTNFGKHFDVVSKPKANDLAYTNLGIKAHTDNPYRKPMPGIQILHCISNEAKGGDSSLVDGYAVAEYLKIYEPEMFQILTTTNVLFKFVDKDIILENYSKLIELDHNGKYLQSTFSGRLDYVPYLEPPQLEKFYAARKKLFHLYESEEFELNFRLDSGMLMMFDNIRVLHGRTEYDINTGFRHLQGCYIDHDSTEGKLRRLKSNL
ncbi:TauD/TfdA family dioxygenase [Pelagibacteraceae bacterium]|nr:TauD/TfdA family dioxygenase [Pelagibacteraceae bacterium]